MLATATTPACAWPRREPPTSSPRGEHTNRGTRFGEATCLLFLHLASRASAESRPSGPTASGRRWWAWPPVLCASVCLPTPSTLARHIRGVRTFLVEDDVDDGTADDLRLCVHECCANAIRHSGSTDDIEVWLILDEDDVTKTWSATAVAAWTSVAAIRTARARSSERVRSWSLRRRPAHGRVRHQC